MGIIGGHKEPQYYHIPWPLPTVGTDVEIEQGEGDDMFTLKYITHLQQKAVVQNIRGLDMHVMNKEAMEAICANS